MRQLSWRINNVIHPWDRDHHLFSQHEKISPFSDPSYTLILSLYHLANMYWYPHSVAICTYQPSHSIAVFPIVVPSTIHWLSFTVQLWSIFFFWTSWFLSFVFNPAFWLARPCFKFDQSADFQSTLLKLDRSRPLFEIHLTVEGWLSRHRPWYPQ